MADRYKEREELKHKILSVTTAADDDEDTDKINNMLNKLGPECKSVKSDVKILMTKSEGKESFELITPIYLQNMKMLGKVDTGSDISCINKAVFINRRLGNMGKTGFLHSRIFWSSTS